LGDRLKLLNHKLNFDPRTRPWYTAAVAAGQSTWSQIYPNTAGITSYLGASMPFYDKQGKLQGVLLTNINLSKDKNARLALKKLFFFIISKNLISLNKFFKKSYK
jgi:hypothetical protein